MSLANRLYHFLAEVVEFAHSKGLIVVVENPRSSLFGRRAFGSKSQYAWATRHTKHVLMGEKDQSGQLLHLTIVLSLKIPGVAREVSASCS